MSFYREEYLKSEEWKTLRIAVLARDDAACQVCGTRHLSNDVHHISYGESIFEVRESELLTLCRRCHELIHEAMGVIKRHPGYVRKIGADWARFRRCVTEILPLVGREAAFRPRLAKVVRSSERALREKQACLDRIEKEITRLEQWDDRDAETIKEQVSEIRELVGFIKEEIEKAKRKLT